MPSGRDSLLAGRRTEPLSDQDASRVVNTFLGLDKEAPCRHGPGEKTRCRVVEFDGEFVCEIVFGADIFPGTGTVDPNSYLSMRAAAAHELSHFHRWKDKTELSDEKLEGIDEALTSLDAVQRFYTHLNETEIRALVADAMQRLQRHLHHIKDSAAGNE